jgi:hypothetical protein
MLNMELLQFHLDYDPLFARLASEVKQETNPDQLQVGLALLQLAMEGRVRIIQGETGELLFEHAQPN